MGGKAGREVGERKDKVALRGWICLGRGGTWRELDSPGPSAALASKACQPTVPAWASSCGAGSHTNLPNGRAAALLPPLQPCTRFSCGHSNSDPHREGNPAKRTSLAKVTSHHNTLRQYSPVSLSSLKGRVAHHGKGTRVILCIGHRQGLPVFGAECTGAPPQSLECPASCFVEHGEAGMHGTLESSGHFELRSSVL